MDRRRVLRVAGVGTGLLLSGCVGDTGGRPTVERTTTTGGGDTAMTTNSNLAVSYGYTYTRENGNRVVEGAGRLPDVEPTDIDLDGRPRWIATTRDHLAGESRVGLWAVVLASGQVELFRVPPEARGEYERVPIETGSIPAGMPPLLAVSEDRARLVTQPGGGSSLTHPVVVDDRLVYVDGNGDLVVRRGGEEVGRFDEDALPDARLVTDNANVYALTGATNKYGHGALGDGTEATTVSVLDPFAPRIRHRFAARETAVFEGVMAMLGSLSRGGEPHVIVTETDDADGARIVAYTRDGERAAAGPAIGQGFRWRHQLCVAPFAPDGVPEVAVVKTPHIGGTVEFYRREGAELSIAATAGGYSSHAYQSRNLDGALAGDFDDDGRLELLVPTDDRERLVGVARTEDGAAAAWEVPVGGSITSNLAAGPRGERTAVGVGRKGTLRIW